MTNPEVEIDLPCPPLPRKLYLIMGKLHGVNTLHELANLNELEAEEFTAHGFSCVEIGTPHPDLDRGVFWTVTGILRRDLCKILGTPESIVPRPPRDINQYLHWTQTRGSFKK
jgi:hypothetical protein